MGWWRTCRNILIAISMVCPAGSFGQNSESEKIKSLKENLCATKQPFKNDISEIDSDSQGDFCATCELKPNSIVNLQKIAKAFAEEARLKREIEFLKFYLSSDPNNILYTIRREMEHLNLYKEQKDFVDKKLASLKFELEAIPKQQAAIDKLAKDEDMSQEERTSLAGIVKAHSAEGENVLLSKYNLPPKQTSKRQMSLPPKIPPHLKYNSSPQPPLQNQSLPDPPPEKESADELKKYPSHLEMLKSYKEYQDWLEAQRKVPDKVQKWLEGDDRDPPPDISKQKMALVLKDAIQSKLRANERLEEAAKQFAKIIQETEGRIEKLKERHREEQAKILSPTLTDMRSQLTSLENEIKGKISYRLNPCRLSLAEILAIENYTVDGYKLLNGALRRGGKEAENISFYAETLKAALKKFRKYEGTVRRGADLPPDVLEKHQEGAVVEYPAFTSTSVEHGFSRSHRFIIKTKNGAYIAPYSPNYREQEVIIPPGNFKVLSRGRNWGFGIEIVLEQVD